jgi:hypothetical protein
VMSHNDERRLRVPRDDNRSRHKVSCVTNLKDGPKIPESTLSSSPQRVSLDRIGDEVARASVELSFVTTAGCERSDVI